MRFKQLWLLIALVLAFAIGSVCAEAVMGAVVVPEQVAEHNLVTVSSDTQGEHYVWWVDGPRGLEVWKPITADKSEITFTGPPGKYRIFLAVVPAEGEPTQADALMTIVEGDVDPDPDPDPTPDPDVDPPGPSQWQVVIVYESNDLDNYPAAQQAIIKSLVFRKRLAEAGHQLLPGGVTDQHVVDRNRRVPERLAPYLNACKGDPLPRICISPIDAGPVQDFDLPADGDAVLALLKGAKQ